MEVITSLENRKIKMFESLKKKKYRDRYGLFIVEEEHLIEEAMKNFALETVPGTEMKYYEYVAANSAVWTNIMTNLGFYPKENITDASSEPDWDNLDWATLTQKAE